MSAALTDRLTAAAQDREIASTVQRERGRLLAFIRRRIADAAEAEDVLQEALYELVLAYRMMQPVQQAGAWLTRVARHRIIDRFRRNKPQQREVFVAHELDGLSFRELSARSGVGVNTLLSRKRYAVLHLQQRLRAAWDDWLLT